MQVSKLKGTGDFGIPSPSGIVVEGDFQRARDVFKQSLSLEDLKKMIKDALRHASNLGLTCLGFVSCDERALSALMSLWRDGEIATKIRVYLNRAGDVRREKGCMRTTKSFRPS